MSPAELGPGMLVLVEATSLLGVPDAKMRTAICPCSRTQTWPVLPILLHPKKHPRAGWGVPRCATDSGVGTEGARTEGTGCHGGGRAGGAVRWGMQSALAVVQGSEPTCVQVMEVIPP